MVLLIYEVGFDIYLLFDGRIEFGVVDLFCVGWNWIVECGVCIGVYFWVGEDGFEGGVFLCDDEEYQIYFEYFDVVDCLVLFYWFMFEVVLVDGMYYMFECEWFDYQVVIEICDLVVD